MISLFLAMKSQLKIDDLISFLIFVSIVTTILMIIDYKFLKTKNEKDKM